MDVMEIYGSKSLTSGPAHKQSGIIESTVAEHNNTFILSCHLAPLQGSAALPVEPQLLHTTRFH